MPSFLLLLPPSLLWLLATVDGAKAAVCNENTRLIWQPLTFNNQTPCEMVGPVAASCTTESPSLHPLGRDERYPAPGQDTSGGSTVPLAECTCTLVMYNLVSACASCQLADPNQETPLSTRPVDEWNSACDRPGLGITFKPSLTDADAPKVPPWANLAGNFNLQSALQNATSATALPTGLPLLTETQAPSATATPTSTAAADSGSSSSISTGAIVGIVVAVVAIIALAIIAFLVWRRVNRQKTAPSSEFMQYSRAPVMSIDENAPYDPPPAFTPGHFQDPIFEKGIAIANANAASAPASSPTGTQAQTPPSLETSPLNVEATSSGWRVKEEEIGFTKQD